jgi:MSHA biogenesis protein MshJ
MNASLWTELQVWFALRGLRERAIVLIAVLVALGYGWQFLVKDGLEQYVQTEIRNLAQLQSQNAALEAQRAALDAVAEADPNTLLQRTIARLNAQNTRLDLEIEAMSGKLVQPADMAIVLSRVMSQQGGVTLLAMQNRPPESLFFRTGNSDAGALVIYKHGLDLTLKGSYLDVLKYLVEIESLGVRFFWERVEYKAVTYPEGEIAIQVFTLSTQEQLLDV